MLATSEELHPTGWDSLWDGDPQMLPTRSQLNMMSQDELVQGTSVYRLGVGSSCYAGLVMYVGQVLCRQSPCTWDMELVKLRMHERVLK